MKDTKTRLQEFLDLSHRVAPDFSREEPTGVDTAPDWLSRLDRQAASTPDRHALADAALEAALEFSCASRGNVQFADRRGVLHIEAQRGFGSEFLEFFESVHSNQAACGAAKHSGMPVIVDDVANSALFMGTPALDVMMNAGALAVASFPICGGSRRVVGVLSVHYDRPRRPSDRALGLLEGIAARAGRLLRAYPTQLPRE